MIVNPDKFYAIVLQKQDKNSQTNSLNIDDKIIEKIKLVKLLGITNDSQLRFDERISNLCNRASMQWNAINRIQKHVGPKEIKAIINSFIYANFNYFFLFDISVHPNEKFCLRFDVNIEPKKLSGEGLLRYISP